MNQNKWSRNLRLPRWVEIVKSNSRGGLLFGLALGAWLAGGMAGQAQVTVAVDPGKSWIGYMSWYDTSDKYLGGTNCLTAKLPAGFVPNSASAARLVLGINSSTYATNGVFNLADGTPNRILDTDFYVELGTNYGGQTVTFNGVVESNSLPSQWTAYAVVKEFTPPNYGYVGADTVPLTSGAFTVSRHIGAGDLAQFGFYIYGPNTPPGSADSRQTVSILVANPAQPAVKK